MHDELTAGNELGTFLRARREAITPAEVGLPAGNRRRTPGLRRTELAMLADISVEYLTRLEQGRDRNPSPQVIGSLADALRLSPGERHLLRMAIKAAGGMGSLCPAGEPAAQTVRPTLRALLDRLEPSPAVLLNWLTDVVAWTSGFAHLVGPLGMLDDERPNLLRYVFADERALTAFPDWAAAADQHAAALKTHTMLGDPHALELANMLAAESGTRFTGRFTALAAVPEPTGLLRLAHPEAGELSLVYETLDAPDSDGLQLRTYLPADDATSAALDGLEGRRPGALRAVSGG
ncbi:helix-turn-helix domain-containing protein [Phytoactinopolyspora halotolerans]|uniref:Helix-turn-helix domain-containing protein n=1 Tax=Phytoactinopolyspora halotolerans TaxID=1981512 RepID=A0A6L9S9N4_9ACTN|nr:helix-turn-helix domain-containing protein [Phytoactinopolyspora halotolerans]